MEIPEHIFFIAGFIIFGFGLFLKLIWVSKNSIQKDGYMSIEDQDLDLQERIASSSSTFLEGLIFTFTFLQFGFSVTLLILGWLESIPVFSMWYHLSTALGWIFHLWVLYLSLYPFSSAPRYSFFSLFLSLGLQSYYLIFNSQTDRLYNLLNQIALGLSVALICCDFVNPPKYAHILESIKKNGRYPCGEDLASPYSLVTFSWVNKLLETGRDHSLESEDMPDLTKPDRMAHIIDAWNRFKQPNRSVVWNSLLFTKRFAIFQLLLAISSTILDFAKPFFINRLLDWIQKKKSEDPIDIGVYYLIGMFLSSLLREVLYGQIYLSGRHWGIQLRAAFVYEIFKKSLRRTGGASIADEDPSENQKASQGKIVSLMSADVNSLRWFLTDIHSILIDTPLSILMSVSGLLYLMGPSALAGLFVIIISGPISSWILTKLYKLLKETRSFCDKRIQITNEALLGIRIIKYMAWEQKIIDKMRAARDDELNSRFALLKNNLLLTCVTWSSSILVTFVSFFFYTIVAGHHLDAATAFTAISLLSTLSFVLNDVSQTVSQVLNIRVTLKRINTFLSEDELEKFGENIVTENLSKDAWIGYENGYFGYYGPSTSDNENQEAADLLSDDNNSFRLQNINVKFPKGKLSAIIGSTGAGKTSLLLTLLGEMKQISGKYSIPEHHLADPYKFERSDVAYVSQNAWLMNATIRDNVLFGEPYDEARYLSVIRACALLPDLDALEYGDLTEIGEKGVNLSGGQKQRVSLARAAYSKASIILLDDPLSAVDAPTGRHLLTKCILSLLKGRTVILVTHAVSLVLPNADHIIVCKNGSIMAQGSPKAISDNKALADIVATDLLKSNDDKEVPDELIPLKSVPQENNKEGKAAGSVKWIAYQSYLVACGGILFVAGIFLSFFVQVAADYLQNWWVEVWVDSMKLSDIHFLISSFTKKGYNLMASFSSLSNSGSLENSQNDSLWYISIFGLISFVELFALLLKYIIQFVGGIRASRIMHEKLTNAVLGSPMRFFEITPVGRIINRFSKDLSDIDLTVMWSLMSFGTVVFGAIIRVILVSCVTPTFAFSLLLVFFYWRIAIFYLASSREIKRLESVSNSPIYSLFGEVLNGASTIRAFGAEKQFVDSIVKKVDANHRSYFYLFATNRWLNMRTAILSSVIVFVSGISILFSNLSAGWAGLTFNFATQITSMINRSIQIHSSLEMAMNAVERIDEYSLLPQEPLEGIETPDESWPMEGTIVVKDLAVKYAPELPEVLKGVSFTINAREKVAIVGRTGAGKSTFSLALFRILPFESGTIYIDNIDIQNVGVRNLRSRLTMIPQDPILFEGTLRSNLDPLNEHTDAEIWEALRLTHVLESLQDSGGNSPTSISLENVVNENGSNFSQGQRQLICLARALLRSSKIIFMDEATASVDPETDAKIQKTIRGEFSYGTVITVAHRLKTIIDYDRILVLDSGSVAQYGPPYELLQEKNGIFYQMCKESGDFDMLKKAAKIVNTGG